jgi:purine-binding chemotaxis protein CheW
MEAWLVCQTAAHVCALPLTSVVETMRPLPVETFPKAPAFVAGMAIIRGEPTAVVNMRALMGEPPASSERFVTVKIGGRAVALAFDAILGVHRLNKTRAIDLPPLLKSVAEDTISQVTTRDSALLMFFESSRIFPPGLIENLAMEKVAR